jgi:NAD(P)-dependent dehydrogenase (short-subunit alcohol dehydrogenase family)
MASYLITGCSRGLGLALTSHLLTFPPSDVGAIIATARNESPSLKELVQKSEGRVKYIQLDTTNDSSIKNAVAEVQRILEGKGLDVLINNAGISRYVPNGIVSM